MASKKNKKSKGVTMSIGEFVSKVEETSGAPTAGAGQNVVYSEKKSKMPTMSVWADEEEDDPSFYEKERIILPSAPRAARGPAYDDSEIPREPPFTAHLGNLPYDIDEDEMFKFFRDLDIQDLKLPRDQQTMRLRGFGYAEFGSRQGLIDALTKNEQMIRGRPVRITLGTGQQDRRGGMDRDGMRGDGERRRGRPPAEDDDVDDWRTMMKPQGFDEEPSFRRGPPPGDYGSMPRGGGGFRDRGYGGGPPRGPRGPPQDEEEIEFSRDQMVQGPPPQHYNTYGGRSSGPRGDGYGNRGRDFYDNRDRGDRGYGGGGGGGSDYYNRGGPPSYHQQQQQYPPSSQHSRHHSESSDHGGPPREETWRRGPREHTVSQSSQNSYNHPSSAYPPAPRSERSESPPLRRGDREMRHRSRDRAMSPSERDEDHEDYDRRHRDEDDEDDRRPVGPPQSQAPKERPRLVVLPRTVDRPVGEIDAGSSSIFGGAKPVDTQRREREIEEKLEKLKVDEIPKVTPDESKEGTGSGTDGEQGAGSGGEGPPREQRRERGPPSQGGEGGLRGGDRDRERDRPKQFRLLTRAGSGGGSKEAYIELDTPIAPLGGSSSTSAAAATTSTTSAVAAAASRSRLVSGPLRAPPPLPINPPQTQQQAYSRERFNLLRSDDKDRGGPGPYRGRGGGGPRRGEMDRSSGSGGRGGDYRRGPPRDHDGSMRGGGGRPFERDYGSGPRGGGRAGGYSRDRDYDRDDYRRGPPPHPQSNNNQYTSLGGNQSEDRDRDSHSEPEDDRDMIRGGGDRGDKGPRGGGGEFSDEDSGDFTRVERRGRKSYSNRMNTSSNNNSMSTAGSGARPPPPPRSGGGMAPDRSERW